MATGGSRRRCSGLRRRSPCRCGRARCVPGLMVVISWHGVGLKQPTGRPPDRCSGHERAAAVDRQPGRRSSPCSRSTGTCRRTPSACTAKYRVAVVGGDRGLEAVLRAPDRCAASRRDRAGQHAPASDRGRAVPAGPQLHRPVEPAAPASAGGLLGLAAPDEAIRPIAAGGAVKWASKSPAPRS